MALRLYRMAAPILMLCLTALPTCPAAERPCIAPEDAARHLNRDVCVAAHIYDVVELADGTRFLDVCSPETPDEQCRFSIVSLREDRREVGDLSEYKGREVRIRGVIRPFNARTEMVLSHERQFRGGSEKFRPNPALLKGFSAEDHGTAFRDPTLRASRHRSAFHPPR